MFEVNKDSWHYRWIAFAYSMANYPKYRLKKAGWQSLDYESFYDNYAINRPYNFCMYWRHVLVWPGIRLFVSLVLYGLLAASLYHCVPLIWLALGEISVGIGSLVLFMGGIAAFFLAFIWGVTEIAKVIDAKVKDNSSLLGQMYRSYKDKYCPDVTYKKD